MNIDDLTVDAVGTAAMLIDRGNRENIALALLERYDGADTEQKRAAIQEALGPDLERRLTGPLAGRKDEERIARAVREATASPARPPGPYPIRYDPRTPLGMDQIAGYRRDRRDERGGVLPALDLAALLDTREKVLRLREEVERGTEAKARWLLADLSAEPVNLQGALDAAVAVERSPAAVSDYLRRCTAVSPLSEPPGRMDVAELGLHDLPEFERYDVLAKAVHLLEQGSRECAILTLLRGDEVAKVDDRLGLMPSMASLSTWDGKPTDEQLIADSAAYAAAAGGTSIEDVQREMNRRPRSERVDVAKYLARRRAERNGVEPPGEFLDWLGAHAQFAAAQEAFDAGAYADFRLGPRQHRVERSSLQAAVTLARGAIEHDASRKAMDEAREYARSTRWEEVPMLLVPVLGAAGVVGGIIALANGASADVAGTAIGIGAATLLGSAVPAAVADRKLRSAKAGLVDPKERVATAEQTHRAANLDFRSSLRLASLAAGRGRTVGGS